MALPVRSWRSALIVACLGGAAAVCITLAYEVREATSTLRSVAAQTLRDYASAAGKTLGVELLKQSNEFRLNLYAPVLTPLSAGERAISLVDFGARADSLYKQDRYEPDALRGYMRVDVSSGRWEGLRATSDSALAQRVADTLLSHSLRGTAVMPSGLVQMHVGPTAMTASFVIQQDPATKKTYAYVVTQTRAVNFQHAMNKAMAAVPILPPSFTGSAWNVDAVGGDRAYALNDSLIGVRAVGVDGSLLYASSHWFPGSSRASYEFQTGPGGFAIETVFRPGLESRLLPSAVRRVSQRLYLSLGTLGALLIIVSIVAFWGEMTRQRAARQQSLIQLTTGLRHELNNALASVMLESQLLASSEGMDPEARRAGAAIAEQAERMRHVILRLDHVDDLPVVDYYEGKSMVDLAVARRTQPA